MSWAFILLLVFLLVAGLFVLGRVPASVWTTVAAALVFALAGYVWQGHASLRGQPRNAANTAPRFDEELAKMRNSFGGAYGSTGQWLTLSDGLARQGKSKEAANVLGAALRSSPKDALLWVGMGNALLTHGEGIISPAAEYSYKQAIAAAPQGSAAPFFYGLALAASGRYQDARRIWADLLARLPEKAPLYGQLKADIGQLDALLARQAENAAQ